ncbi:unnamed protein product (macronuclear) [Paramecium tetraurelia]|uniref:EF-hand domain-containing protein n=1 Tax=Paramecium tetraurelia TaxID=5888 RepID=A0BQ11_PARTE|nr:uncharacterized protein GSPATT00005379001 [Paramecium tetraurelia]CAK60628.1 unnamed protein product [Paramecium tetraurelia]|eukprot:XP_001428026.1 hypothetical protein (macronuclear) [Paramecium tetraurelia strain d4-2]
MSFREILNNTQKVKKITKVAFNALDEDDSGFLERKELISILNNCADTLKIERPSSEEMDEILKELDENSDGKVSENEFQALIEKVLRIMAKIEEK